MTQLEFWGYDADGRLTSTGRRLVYFVECRGQIKIGFTTRDVRERIKEFETGNPDECKLLGAIAVPEGRDDRYFHQQFAMFRRRGEWFDKVPALMAAIDRLLQAERRRNSPPQAPVNLCVLFSRLEEPEDFGWGFDCPSCQKFLALFLNITVRSLETQSRSCRCTTCGASFMVHFSFVHKDKAA